MLSLQLVRQNPDLVRDSMSKRGETSALDEITGLDEKRRRLLQEVESLRARRKQASKEIGRMEDKPEELRAEMREIGEQIKSLERLRVMDALNRCGGNQTRAAELLGVSRRTMVSRLRELGIPGPRKRKGG